MPPTLASLVQHSALKLAVRAGADRLGTPVRWAHASELADPVPYMDGGELLLVTATNLDARDPGTMRRYVQRLVGAGVAGIGFGVGVTYDEIPPALVDAAEEAGLPLLEVPRRTPFLAISKAVSAAIAADQYRSVTAGFEAQRELTRAAVAGDGPRELLTRLAAHVDGWAALYDSSGAVVAAAPDWAARRAGISPKGRWRAGGALVARGEFSIVIAGLAVTAGIEPDLGPLATAYVLVLVVLGPLTARYTEPIALRLTARRTASADTVAAQATAPAAETLEPVDESRPER